MLGPTLFPKFDPRKKEHCAVFILILWSSSHPHRVTEWHTESSLWPHHANSAWIDQSGPCRYMFFIFLFFSIAPALNCLSWPLRCSRLHLSGRLRRLALCHAGSRTSSGCNQTLISRCFIKVAGAAALGGSSLCLALGLPFHPMLMRLPLVIYELSSVSPHRLALQVYGCMNTPSAGRNSSLQGGTEKNKPFTVAG